MTIDRWFVLANLIGALIALVLNGWDAWKGWPDFRPVRTMVAVLSAVYVAAYAVLLAGVWIGTDRVRWSQTVIGLGPVVWAVVWCGPAVTSRVIARKVKAGTARALTVPDPHDVRHHRRHV